MSSHGYHFPPPQGQAPFPGPGFSPQMMPPRRRGIPVWGWILIVIVGLVVLSCAGFFGFAAYIGSVGPDTKVYNANEIPKKYLDVVSGLGLIDQGEEVKFFYSDALTDVRDGMYFVTDKKVVVYIADSATPKTIVPFAKIEEAVLDSNDSIFTPGSITLTLTDGSAVVFPVSGEGGRDKLMFNAIETGRKGARGKR